MMSAYNGEKYISTQIDSILAQKDVDVTLNIYDDVSHDGTVAIAREYEKKHRNVLVHENSVNKNYTYNFIDALFSFKDNNEFDYYAFSDQDDYWAEDKLISAIKKIEEKGECSLYASNLKVVDSDLKPLGRNNRENNYQYHIHDQLFFCLVNGCTAVFDKKFKDLVVRHYPQNLVYHDYWIALIANYCQEANFIFDMCPDHILYRQHGSNASGGAVKIGFLKRVKNFFKGSPTNFYILKLFLDTFNREINDENKELITKFLDYKHNKMYLIKKLNCSRKKRVMYKILFNKLRPQKVEEM